jgi:hypothetical protein
MFPIPYFIRPKPLMATAAAVIALLGTATVAAAPAADAAFVAESEAAMTRMMDNMAIHPSGDVARDFVAMMSPHHQGAIDMAQAYLRYGNNEQLRRVAQEIIVEQQQEIIAMRLALGLPLPPSAAAATQQSAPPPVASPADHHHSHIDSPANKSSLEPR